MATNIVVMFDFDKTIIDCDSDNWVIDHLGGTQLFDELLKTMPWNSAMVCELRIVSDANRFFIDTILEHHGLISYFSEINTNPGYVDEVGRLRVFPHHDFKTSPHGCSLCPPNMCKVSLLAVTLDSPDVEDCVYDTLS
ncbi:hypothetical protein GW17_00017748 [Ensete ventricosum]|nr:hypothetical protein GW17_00017748 [Ensete ventricosum]